MELYKGISSKAVVKYEEHATIPSYVELDKDTDLNHPPSNWLHENLTAGNFSYQNTKKKEPFDYSSLLMAGHYPEIIGEVDVVAGANLIKKLLKMPFSDGSLSMSVHRVGKTLLLNQLDIPALLHSPYYANNDNLEWLRNLYCEARGMPLDSEFHPRKRNKEQSELQLILSKFMYHSIDTTKALENKTTDPTDISSSDDMITENALSTFIMGKDHSLGGPLSIPTDGSNSIPSESCTEPTLEIVKPTISTADKCDSDITTMISKDDNILVPSSSKQKEVISLGVDPIVDMTTASDLASPIEQNEHVTLDNIDATNSNERFEGGMKSDSAFLRDVLWTFEDITMLVGSDLPIFGGGKYPAVSLRLSDSSKPINILTGIDYWLDNLMCNVPELIMCFHLKGIVQKYEKIKTSDLPDIEGSSFSPKVIKDIAQNILSFLKANCTKEGHTYWLFKSSKDDVIKLYDLTSICAEKTYGKQQDPFSVSVAVLLYNIARNMYTSGEINSRNIYKIRSLLKNCINLLGSKDRPDVSLLANFLLLELYNDQDEESDGEGNSYEEEEDSEDVYSTDDDLGENAAGEPITTVSVKSLGAASNVHQVELKGNAEKSVIVAVNEESRCKNTITLITNSLKSINILLYMCKVSDISQGRPVMKKSNINTQLKLMQNKENNEAMMPFIQHDLKCVYLHNKKNVRMKSFSLVGDIKDLSLGDIRILLLEKAVEVHLTLIDIGISKDKFGRALRLIQTCCYCLDNARQMSNSFTHNTYLSIEVLKLYGDVITIMANKNFNKESELEDFYALNEVDQSLHQLLEYDDASQFFGIKIKNIADGFVSDREELLNSAAGVYEKAITIIGDHKGKGDLSVLLVDLSRRLGNIRNELGVLYMNKAASITKQYGFPSDDEMNLWKQSYALYEGAITSFKTVSDRPNIALLYLNCGKLMYLCAQVYGNSSRIGIGEPRGLFTQQEKTYFNKSFEYYQKALSVLHSRDDYPTIWTNVSLELSGVYLNMAITMNESDIKSTQEEKTIKEISSAFMKALHYSESVIKECNGKQEMMVKHRMGSIHHHLATLYFHVLKNQTSDNGKKNYRSLSELHFKKVYLLAQPNLFPIDVLRVLLEHMNFYEYVWKQTSAWRDLKLKFEMFCPAKPSEGEHARLLMKTLQEVLIRVNKKDNGNMIAMDTTVSEKDGINAVEVEDILNLLDIYVNTTLKEVIKFLSDKKNKKGDFMDLKFVKKVFEVVLRGRIVVKEKEVKRTLNAFVSVLMSICNLKV